MQSEITDEARRILDMASQRGLLLRLLGGVAVKYHCPSASHRALQRSYPDLDFVGLSRQGHGVRKLFLDLGYQGNQRFNALHGRTRLMFDDPTNNRAVDVFLDIFKMCHTLHLEKRLALDKETIPISDLLLTKLQVVEVNEKDVRDTISILHDHQVSSDPSDREGIDASYIASLCARDWGWHMTIKRSLLKILALLSKYELSQDAHAILEKRITQLLETITKTPKTLRWKMRALLGERVRWYDLPEMPIRT